MTIFESCPAWLLPLARVLFETELEVGLKGVLVFVIDGEGGKGLVRVVPPPLPLPPPPP